MPKLLEVNDNKITPKEIFDVFGAHFPVEVAAIMLEPGTWAYEAREKINAFIKDHKVLERPRVIVESPFASPTSMGLADNLQYLRRALRDSWDRGENPFASHGFYPFFLHEHDPSERKAGIEAGYEMWKGADLIVFYVDLGMSPGMQKAWERSDRLGLQHVHRSIGDK